MKFVILSLFCLVFSFKSYSYNNENWLCEGKTPADVKAIAQLRLSPLVYLPELHLISVFRKDYCSLRSTRTVVDTCNLDGHLLIVKSDLSFIKTAKGKIIKLHCYPDSEVGPNGGVGGSN